MIRGLKTSSIFLTTLIFNEQSIEAISFIKLMLMTKDITDEAKISSFRSRLKSCILFSAFVYFLLFINVEFRNTTKIAVIQKMDNVNIACETLHSIVLVCTPEYEYGFFNNFFF